VDVFQDPPTSESYNSCGNVGQRLHLPSELLPESREEAFITAGGAVTCNIEYPTGRKMIKFSRELGKEVTLYRVLRAVDLRPFDGVEKLFFTVLAMDQFPEMHENIAIGPQYRLNIGSQVLAAEDK
jgi:hypothetical protein